MTKPEDQNDRLIAGKLPSDLISDTRVVHRKKDDIPRADDAERSLIASLLWTAKNNQSGLKYSQVQDAVEPEHFFDRRLADILEAIAACAAAKAEYDSVSVATQLMLAGKDGPTGAVSLLDELVAEGWGASEPTARAWAEAIKDAHSRREIIAKFSAIVQEAKAGTSSAIMLLDRCQSSAVELTKKAGGGSDSVSITTSMHSLFERLASTGKVRLVKTGFAAIDKDLGGLHLGETSIVAARTGLGKSAWTAQLALNAIRLDQDMAAMFVSLEMPHEAFSTRLLASKAGIPIRSFRMNDLTPSDWSRVTTSAAQLAESGLYFVDSPSQTLASIFSSARTRANALAKEGKILGLLVIDHIALVKPSSESLRRASGEQQLAEISRGLRYIASEIGCHVLAVCQIGRAAETQGPQGGQIPKLHHLRGSDAIAQDSDLVFILHRERDSKTGMFVKGQPALIQLIKGRYDQPASWCLGFNQDTASFYDWDGDNPYAGMDT